MKAVIFDLDGVIVLSEALEVESFNETLAPFNVKLDFKYFIETFSGQGAKSILEQLVPMHNIPASVDALLEEKRTRMLEKVRTKNIPLVPGVLEFIHEIRLKKIPTMIGTGGNKLTARLKLAKIGLDLDLIATADVANGKPAPDIYLACAKKLNVDPKDCVVFEDAPSGVRAAKAAGMKCVGIMTDTDGEHLNKAGVDMLVTDFTQVDLEKLKELF